MLETLGDYRILERVGAGGLGDVYRARDTRHGRTVAIKLLPASIANDAPRRDAFLRDARAAAALSHPSIVTLYEVGEDGTHLFLVFDFVPGETLKTVIAGRPLNLRRALDLAAQIADGLADAHAAGIVHHDIRPENIIVTPKGAAKILDVGLSSWTNGGTAPRAEPYRAPEHGSAAAERADIFSLGVVLYEMLTGAPPPTPIAEPWPADLNAIVSKALAKDPERRYQSAAFLASDLRTLTATLDARSDARSQTGQAAAPPLQGQRQGHRPGGRSAVARVVVALAAIAALAALVWTFYAR
jgi:serine/threonine-protein kinase